LRRGACKMSAIGACMRKLLAIAYGVLKTGTSFEVPA
ncbi:IS110 family transposase, partial [bacterium]|nr:IS110 family transposase [bacterium]MCE5324399.1 IS110 family transposase [bacterium]